MKDEESQKPLETNYAECTTNSNTHTDIYTWGDSEKKYNLSDIDGISGLDYGMSEAVEIGCVISPYSSNKQKEEGFKKFNEYLSASKIITTELRQELDGRVSWRLQFPVSMIDEVKNLISFFGTHYNLQIYVLYCMIKNNNCLSYISSFPQIAPQKFSPSNSPGFPAFPEMKEKKIEKRKEEKKLLKERFRNIDCDGIEE